jgi:glycosyltransferase involved in cell wall biosynthesis
MTSVRGSSQQTTARLGADRTFILEWGERLDLLVHALAQLPDDVMLDVDANHRERAMVELLASAYGMEDRVAYGQVRQANPSAVVSRSFPPLSPVAPPSSAEACRSMAELLASMSSPGDLPARLHSQADVLFAGHRVALVSNFATHYRLPLFDAMSARLHDAGASFRVFFTGRNPRGRPWLVSESRLVFDHEMVPGVELPFGTRRPYLTRGLQSRLRAFKPTLILCGSFSPFVAGPVQYFAGRRGIAWGLWSGETSSMQTAQSPLRRIQRRALARGASFGVAYGHAAAGYLKELRSNLPLVYGRNTAPVAERGVRPEGDRPETVEVLVVGDLASPRKGVDVVLDALGMAPDLCCRLTVVGGGRLLPELALRAAGDARIRFTGPLCATETRRLYESADIVLFPTRADIFGLVLVEAMGAGTAVACSTAAGAIADLAVHNHNCLVVEGHEPEVWAAAVSRLVNDPTLRGALGTTAARVIHSRWSIEHAADAMLAGLRLGLLAEA